MARRRWAIGVATFAALTVLTLVAALIWPSPDKSGAEPPGSTTTTSSIPDEGKQECPDSWARTDSDKGGNRWFANGVPAIAAATNADEARAAATEWVNGVRTDPVLLAGAAKYVVHIDVDQATLFRPDGCATATAVDVTVQITTALALSKITPSEAPANGHNSGTDGASVVGAANPGISGNRKAILIELPDGTKIWVMARCGNPVTEGPPPVSHGPTDENPQEGSTTTTVPQCPPPKGVPPAKWDYVKCQKKDQTFDQMQNESQARQDPQNNTTSGVNTGPTPGAPAVPHVPPPGPAPSPGTPAPNLIPGGYDSGSPTGSGTPGGSTTDSTGTQGGGGKPATQNPVDTGQGGNNSGSIPTPSW